MTLLSCASPMGHGAWRGADGYEVLSGLVLPDRIELSTSPLPMECSTTELRQHALDQENRPKRPLQGGRSLPQGPRMRKRAGSPGCHQIRPKSALNACWRLVPAQLRA